MEEFYRIRRLPPYVFEEVNRAKAKARNGGADIIDLGMGNPDLPAPAHVIDKVKETLGKPRTDRYSASRGIPGLRRAQAAYYERRFGVKLNPDTQIVATLGSKEGFANVAQAITGPGDVVLVPNPSYPIHAFGFLMAGGAIRSVPAAPDEAYFAALERREKALVGLDGHGADDTARHQEAEGVDRVARIGHQHDVTRRSDRLRHVGEAFLGAERGDDLRVGVELHAEAASVI